VELLRWFEGEDGAYEPDELPDCSTSQREYNVSLAESKDVDEIRDVG